MRKHLPIYYHSAGYAEEYHQTESYRASYKLNLMCRDAIREAIETHYKNNSLDEAAAHETGMDGTLQAIKSGHRT